MTKNIFHNQKRNNENIEIKRFSDLQNVKIKKNVDINRLLNRAKLNQQSEKKYRIIFVSSGVFLLCFVGTFIAILG